ncbi:hypothetical protein KW794_02560 [Candidatus Saccharibacteria bacterium]|nr:hypothetical protein [Candidatus Saccharibacteria bacterium]
MERAGKPALFVYTELKGIFMSGEMSHLKDIVEDGQFVTVVIDDPESDAAVVHVIDAAEENALSRIKEIESSSSPKAVVMSYFGLRAVIENKTV